MTKAQLRTRVLTDFGFDVASATVDDIVFDRYRALVVESKFREALVVLDQTAAGQTVFDLASTYADVHTLVIGTSEYSRVGARTLIGLKSGRLRMRLGQGEAGVFGPAFTSAGVPAIELYPEPETAGQDLAALVAEEPAAFSSDSDVPAIPAHLHRYIVYGAIAELLSIDSERFQEADRYEAMFEQGIAKLRAYKTSRVGSGPAQIKVVGVHV